MTSKEMENRSGVPRANIRYYEAEGLLRPGRAKNGYRDYSEADLAVLEKIKLLRRLGVSIEELKDLCGGRAELGPVLDRRLTELQNEKATLARVQQVCGDLRASGESFATLDSEKYLRALDESETAPALPKADAIPTESNMVKRLFARMFDHLLLAMLLFVVIALCGENPTQLSGTGLMIGLQVLTLLLEPLLIWLTGTTPGKVLLGMRLESPEGRRLTYGEAITRHLMMLWYARGLWIPIWSWVQAYRVFKRWTEDEPQPWDADVLYTSRPYSWKNTAAFAAAAVAVVAGAEAVNCACQLPRNRGDLTVSEFAENFNEQADYMNMYFGAYLDEEGTWQEAEYSGNTVVIQTSTSLGDGQDFQYTVEDGKLTKITFSAERGATEDWLSLPTDRMIAAVMAFTWAQKDIPFAAGPRGKILEQMEEAPLEGYVLHQAGTVISLEVECRGFDYFSGHNLLIPQGTADQYVAMTFTIALEE